MTHEPSAATPASANLEETFSHVAARWKRERGPSSFVSEMVQHPAYREIIGLGQAVIPLLLSELEHDPDYWFAALRTLTGTNPVSPENRGKLAEMAAAWVQWGRQQGHHLLSGVAH